MGIRLDLYCKKKVAEQEEAQRLLNGLRAISIEFWQHIVESGFCSHKGTFYKVSRHGKIVKPIANPEGETMDG